MKLTLYATSVGVLVVPLLYVILVPHVKWMIALTNYIHALMLVLDVVVRIHANHVTNPIPIPDHDPTQDPAIILLHPDPTTAITMNNANSSGSTQPPNNSHPNSSTPTSPSSNPTYTLPQHIIDDLKAQIKKIANILNALDETVSWMQDTITTHEYRLSELESMMNYDNPGDSDLYPPRDDNENHSYGNNWDDEPIQDTNSRSNLPPYTPSSLMDTSPDASFSTLDPCSVLSSRHVPLPNSRPNIITPNVSASRLLLEISNVTSVQKNLSAQLGISPPNSAILNNNNHYNHSPSLSPLINFGQINVNGL
ncbi:hypothetical protein RhiirA5_506348 [Rhizophagus irregularis]|uniref:Uncharacterized protein n=1 Tax=Rhizophagus irregularis TaxID=588596 RepID=A0A2N0NU36_9GLOM|nr:hypothetical protein RhiirA5_506348 [Rhizophagus irregularis]